MKNPHGIPPNDHVRQQIFYLLKRNSSYTAWNRLLSFYKNWTDATEASLKEASKMGWEDKTSLGQSNYIGTLKGLAYFDEGVQRLRQGDKRVFQYNAHGNFAIGFRIFDHWTQLLQYIETGDSKIDKEHTPLWSEFVKNFHEMLQACLECCSDVLEPEYLDAESQTFYNDWLVKNVLSKAWFPDPLPEIPKPASPVLIATGKNIPCTGIWEPVTALPAKSVFSLFKKPPSAPLGPLPIEGTMAYLHGGSAAPNKSDNVPDGTPTTWKLLWKDDRYEDGSIPAEELNYVFRLPAKKKKPASSPASVANDLLVRTSGQRTPKSGRWLLEGDLNVVLTLDKDSKLPEHQGRSVRWILAIA